MTVCMAALKLYFCILAFKLYFYDCCIVSLYSYVHNKSLSDHVLFAFLTVPLEETIQLAVDKVYSDDNPNKPPFLRETFKKLLQMATTGIFSFNDQLYKQTDGLSMGSPLAPTLTNLFVGHLEEKFLMNYDNTVPLYTNDMLMILF